MLRLTGDAKHITLADVQTLAKRSTGKFLNGKHGDLNLYAKKQGAFTVAILFRGSVPLGVGVAKRSLLDIDMPSNGVKIAVRRALDHYAGKDTHPGGKDYPR